MTKEHSKTSDPAVGSTRLVRPPDASIDGLRKCLRWLDACREIGWADAVMPDLEALFWQYHDRDGNKRPNHNSATPVA